MLFREAHCKEQLEMSATCEARGLRGGVIEKALAREAKNDWFEVDTDSDFEGNLSDGAGRGEHVRFSGAADRGKEH